MQHTRTHSHNSPRLWVFLFSFPSARFNIDSPFSLLSRLARSLRWPALQELMRHVCALERFWQEGKVKVTKGSASICYTLSAALLTLQTPHDGFLVNVKRAGATGWLPPHTPRAFSRCYLHSFHPGGCEVHIILRCAACVCVCVCLVVRRIALCLSLFCQGTFVRSQFISAEKTGAVFFLPHLQRAGVNL